MVIDMPKTDRGRRTVDLDMETMIALEQWRRTQLKERLAYEGTWHESEFVFTRKDGRPLDVDVVSQQFDRLVRKAKLPIIRLHDLRHTHATLLLSEGVPAHVVAARLGHVSEAFTLKQYAHVLPQQQADAVKRLAERLASEG